jgi:N-hydroxyarylamine O-acetyltransferase
MRFSFDSEAYLSRIGIKETPAPDEGGLRTLHNSQFSVIPFENFDIQLGRGINLDPGHLFEKLVRRRRGGYCFELNGLMLLALRALGFQARPLLARVHLETPPSGRTHQLNLVEIGDRSWIMDVGFGAGGLRSPMPLEADRVEEGPGSAFRFQQREPWGFMMLTRVDDEWKDSYSFDLSHVTDADIAVGNHYTSTSNKSHFVTSRIASLPHARGRIAIRDFTLTRIDDGGKATWEIPAGASYLEALSTHFGIELDAGYDELRAVSPRG